MEDFQEPNSHTADITFNSVSIHLQEKKSGNEDNKKENFQVNIYSESEGNKSTE